MQATRFLITGVGGQGTILASDVLAEVGLRLIDAELAAHDVGKPLALEHEGRLVEVGQREVLDHAVSLDVAEQGYLAEYPFIEGAVAAQDDDVGADA